MNNPPEFNTINSTKFRNERIDFGYYSDRPIEPRHFTFNPLVLRSEEVWLILSVLADKYHTHISNYPYYPTGIRNKEIDGTGEEVSFYWDSTNNKWVFEDSRYGSTEATHEEFLKLAADYFRAFLDFCEEKVDPSFWDLATIDKTHGNKDWFEKFKRSIEEFNSK